MNQANEDCYPTPAMIVQESATVKGSEQCDNIYFCLSQILLILNEDN